MNTITICSYNIYWKVLEKHASLSKDINLINTCHNNLINNIKNCIKYDKPDIFCLQEISNTDIINKLFNNKIYNQVQSVSGFEIISCYYNKSIFDLLSMTFDEFEKGRPYTLMVFKHKPLGKYYLVCNLHASHNPDTKNYLYKKIQNTINNQLYNLCLDKINLDGMIMIGDFNSDVNLESKIQFKINNKIIKFKLNKNNTQKTCSNIYGYAFKHNYDHIITSFYPNLRILQNSQYWFKSPASDHMMIKSFIQL